MKAYQLGDVITFRRRPGYNPATSGRYVPAEGLRTEVPNFTGMVVNHDTGPHGVLLGYEVQVHDWEQRGLDGEQQYVPLDEVVHQDTDQIALFAQPPVLLSRAEAMQAERVRVLLDTGAEHTGKLMFWTPSLVQLDMGDHYMRWPTSSLRAVCAA